MTKKFPFSILIGTFVFFLGLGLGPAITHATIAVFNFDTDVLGTDTPFTDTNSGVSATFSSNGDPGGFGITPTFFQSLTGNVLLDPGPAGLNNLALTITFNLPVSTFSLDFALATPDITIPIQGSVFNGSSAIGGFSASGAIPTGFFFPEGHADFVAGSSFNKVTLSSTALDFVVDNISVETAGAVPEPSTLLFLGSGLIGLAGYGGKRLFKR